ncbi:MAG: hypothetical protein O2819_01400 [Planctomycetota bacterium]|nr:hypothetical protein [Planctomycetota bacterium]MDA1105005.1 hypothetical protein [Planctomycetota bacterium]
MLGWFAPAAWTLLWGMSPVAASMDTCDGDVACAVRALSTAVTLEADMPLQEALQAIASQAGVPLRLDHATPHSAEGKALATRVSAQERSGPALVVASRLVGEGSDGVFRLEVVDGALTVRDALERRPLCTRPYPGSTETVRILERIRDGLTAEDRELGSSIEAQSEANDIILVTAPAIAHAHIQLLARAMRGLRERTYEASVGFAGPSPGTLQAAWTISIGSDSVTGKATIPADGGIVASGPTGKWMATVEITPRTDDEGNPAGADEAPETDDGAEPGPDGIRQP